MKVSLRIFPLLYGFIITSGMVLCLFLSIYLHYSKVIKNHCRVWEFWPSVSSAIGDFSPEKNIWRLAIAMSSGPRFCLLFSSYMMLSGQRVLKNHPFLVKLLFIPDFLRIFAAAGWTYVSSSEYLFIHEVCFVCYVLSSLIWCGIHTSMFRSAIISKSKSMNPEILRFQRSYRWKLSCFFIQLIAFFISLYFFLVEHRYYCMKGAYSRYAICEWIFSAANIIYDTMCYMDFEGSYFEIQITEPQKRV